MSYWLTSPWSIPRKFRRHHGNTPQTSGGFRDPPRYHCRTRPQSTSSSESRDHTPCDPVSRDTISHDGAGCPPRPPFRGDIHHNYMEPTVSFLAKVPSRRPRSKSGGDLKVGKERRLKGCLKRDNVRSASPKSVSWDEADDKRAHSSNTSQTIHDDMSKENGDPCIQPICPYINTRTQIQKRNNLEISDQVISLSINPAKCNADDGNATQHRTLPKFKLKKCRKCGRNTVDENKTCLSCYTDIIEQLSSQILLSPSRKISKHADEVEENVEVGDSSLAGCSEQHHLPASSSHASRHPTSAISIITNGKSKRFIRRSGRGLQAGERGQNLTKSPTLQPCIGSPNTNRGFLTTSRNVDIPSHVEQSRVAPTSVNEVGAVASSTCHPNHVTSSSSPVPPTSPSSQGSASSSSSSTPHQEPEKYPSQYSTPSSSERYSTPLLDETTVQIPQTTTECTTRDITRATRNVTQQSRAATQQSRTAKQQSRVVTREPTQPQQHDKTSCTKGGSSYNHLSVEHGDIIKNDRTSLVCSDRRSDSMESLSEDTFQSHTYVAITNHRIRKKDAGLSKRACCFHGNVQNPLNNNPNNIPADPYTGPGMLVSRSRRLRAAFRPSSVLTRDTTTRVSHDSDNPWLNVFTRLPLPEQLRVFDAISKIVK